MKQNDDPGGLHDIVFRVLRELSPRALALGGHVLKAGGQTDGEESNDDFTRGGSSQYKAHNNPTFRGHRPQTRSVNPSKDTMRARSIREEYPEIEIYRAVSQTVYRSVMLTGLGIALVASVLMLAGFGSGLLTVVFGVVAVFFAYAYRTGLPDLADVA